MLYFQPDGSALALYLPPSDDEMTSHLDDLKHGKSGISAVLLQGVANIARVKFTVHTAEGNTITLLPYEAGDVAAEINLWHVKKGEFILLLPKQG